MVHGWRIVQEDPSRHHHSVLVLADQIRTQMFSPMSPWPPMQGVKTPTQHPNFSLTVECAGKIHDVLDRLRPRLLC